MLASDAFLPTLCSSTLPCALSNLPANLSLRNQNKTHGILLVILSILKHSSPVGRSGEVVLTLTVDALTHLFSDMIARLAIGLRYMYD